MGNQTLGRGEVHFSLFKTGTQVPEGFRYLGNTPSFSLTIANQNLDHYSSDRGIKEKDKSIVLQTDSTGSIATDDIQPENLAMYFFGSSTVLTQASATAVAETIIDVIPGRSYQIGVTDSNPTGARSLSAVSVMVASASKTVGTDYTIDLIRGILTIVEGGSIVADADVIVTATHGAVSREQVVSGTDQVEGALRFIAFNPEGDDLDYYMPYVRLSPNGDFNLKGDDWLSLGLSVEILRATNGAERIYIDGQPYTP